MHPWVSAELGMAVPVCGAGWYGWVLWSKYGVLPTRIATHFRLDGTPNGWMSRRVFVGFSVLTLLVLLGVFGFFLARIGGLPGWWQAEALLPFTASFGLLVGAFVAMVESAATGTGYSFLPMFRWMAGMLVAQGAVLAVLLWTAKG